MKGTAKRILALLLAMLCLVSTPLTTYQTADAGSITCQEESERISEQESERTEKKEEETQKWTQEIESERNTGSTVETGGSEAEKPKETEERKESGKNISRPERKQKLQEKQPRADIGLEAESMYLKARAKGVALNKASGVTVGNVKTQLPQGYEAYVRKIAQCQINFKDKTFVPDSGPLKGNTDCVMLGRNDKNKYYAWYRKSIYYKNFWVDIKMTLTEYEYRDGAYFRFIDTRPGIECYKLEWAETRMEFFRSDTGEPVVIQGYVTFKDIDLFQGIVLKQGFGQVYAREEAVGHLKTAVLDGSNYYFDTSGKNQSDSDIRYMISALVSGPAAVSIFTFVRPQNDIGTSTTPSGGISAKAYKIFASRHPHIEKLVSDRDEKRAASNLLDNKDEVYTYILRTMVPLESEETFYRDLSIQDRLDDFLEVKGVSVLDENGRDASGFWNIQAGNAFAAQCRNIKNADFYGHTYEFHISVGVRKNIDLTKRWDEAQKSAVIRNQASASSDGVTLQSGITVTRILPVASSVLVEKRDARTKEKLPGAEFAVYEWNGSSYEGSPAVTLKNEQTGIYQSGNVLYYSAKNQGKFKIVEEKAPQGYEKNGWERTFVISGFEKKEVTYREEEACSNPPLWIEVSVHKKDIETGKPLSEVPFSIYQWSDTKQEYVPYENLQEIKTDQNGAAKTERLYYSRENKGKFRLQEKKAKEYYFGDFAGQDSERGKKTYDFQITEQNAGQTLELTNTEKKNGFFNTPQKAAIAVEKTGEVLKGAKEKEDGVVFVYEERVQEGAHYEIVAAEDIYKADGITLAFRKGECADKIVTGKDGKAVSKMLYLGKYHVIETKAPQGLVRKKTPAENTRTVTLSYRGENVREYVSEEVVFRNERPKADVKVWKKESGSETGLQGARFGLYAAELILADGNVAAVKDQLLETAVSRRDGSCLFQADIPCGYQYYVKEIQAPVNYYKQTEKGRYTFSWSYENDETARYSFPGIKAEQEAVFYNQEVKADISLKKIDAQSGKSVPQQMASLKGAVYGLYAREAVFSADGLGTLRYAKGAEVARKETDEEGTLCFEKVPLGKYEIREIKASEGYLADPKVYPVDCEYEGQEQAVVKRSVTSREKIRTQTVTCFKLTGDNKETDLEWMKNAGFSLFSVSELEQGGYLKKGSSLLLQDSQLVQQVIDLYRDKDTLCYDKMKELKTAQYYDELGNAKRVAEQFSDEKGIVTFRALPYGKYILAETSVPAGKMAAAPKVITVTSDENDGEVEGDGKGIPMPDFAIWDQPEVSYLKIWKKDAATGKVVTKPGARYVIHDIEGAYFNWYMKDKTSEERVDYINRFGNLVVSYTNGEMMGSYENPYETTVRRDGDGHVTGTYVTTTDALPAGLYILEEAEAPEGYIRQGAEGRYRQRDGVSFFEVDKNQISEMQKMHELQIKKEDIGKWEMADAASKDRRVRIQIGSEDALTGYDRLAGAFVTEAIQENEPAVGKISVYTEGERVRAYQKEKGFTYECVPLEGNIFTVRAAEDIYSAEGAENRTLLFAKGSVVTELKTDQQGKACSETIKAAGWEWYGLPVGHYTIEQTQAADGYALTEENKKPRAFAVTYAGQEVPILYHSEAYEIPRQRPEIRTEKYDIESKEKLSGAVFGLYTGQNIMAEDQKTILVPKDTLLTCAETREGVDEAEEALFDMDLPLGVYYVKEEKAPEGYYRSDKKNMVDARSFENTLIRKNYQTVFENRKTMLQVNFMDYDTEVELDGVTFRILDADGNTVSSQVSVHNGNTWIRGLNIGETYIIEETKVRPGYRMEILEKENYESPYKKQGYRKDGLFFDGKECKLLQCGKNRAKIMLTDEESVQYVSLFNQAVFGKLKIEKKGEVPKTSIVKGKLEQIAYENKGLPGAEYDISAEEVIAHPDGYSKALYQAGEKLGHVITDKDGKAYMEEIPLGNYQITETRAPKGYVRSADQASKLVQMNWKESKDTELVAEVLFLNERQKPDIGQDPKEPENGKVVNPQWKGKSGIYKICIDGEKQNQAKGAEFTLYAKEDVTDAEGKIVIPAGTQIEQAVSDDSGRAAFAADLPMGVYMVKETRAPEGYYLSNAEVIFDFEQYKDKDQIAIVRMQGEIRNAATRVRLFLKDDHTGKELAGAKLQIMDEEGKVHTAVSTTNSEGEGMEILGLEPEKKYRIVEIMPRSGYHKEILIPKTMQGKLKKLEQNRVEFSLPQIFSQDNMDNIPKPVKLELENAFLTGTLRVEKTGEILDGAERKAGFAETLWNQIKTWFFYKSGKLENTEFTITAQEDIIHPDGVTGILYHAGDIVEYQVRGDEKKQAKGRTDQGGILEFAEMYLGKYRLSETKEPEGYQKAKEPLLVTLAEADGKAEQVLKEISVYNERRKVKIEVQKKEKEKPEKVLEGAVFGLYAAQDICTREGVKLLEKETLLETQRSDRNGKAVFESDLPTGKYKVCEISAPDGYIKSMQEIEVDASWKEDQQIQTFELVFENQITKTQIRKKAEDTQEALAGAKLALYQDQTCIESWISDKVPHIIEGLHIGETYTLRELEPAPGYVTAEDQNFTVEAKEEAEYAAQEIEMTDAPAEICISVFETDGDRKLSLGNVKAHLEMADGEKVSKENNPSGKDGFWQSEKGKEEYWKKIPVGTYRAVVDEVPEGYVRPQPVEIEVKDTANLQKFEILVQPICIRITGYAFLSEASEKPDQKTMQKGIFSYLKGVYGEKAVELPHVYTHVPAGDYQIKTDSVPAGYVLPKETNITVRKDTEQIQDFDVDIRPTVIKILAVDKQTQKVLDGVKADVLDENGTLVWKNLTLRALKEKVVPAWYTIQVKKVPKGYQKPENKKIQVKAVTSVQKFKIELKKEESVTGLKTDDDTGKSSTMVTERGNGSITGEEQNISGGREAETAAKTGDASWMEMWICAAVMAMSGVTLYILRKGKKFPKKE